MVFVHDVICERTLRQADFIIQNHATVRQVAKKFGLSKSVVHRNLTTLLPQVDLILAKEVRQILTQNKAMRHIRGGQATKLKYANLKHS